MAVVDEARFKSYYAANHTWSPAMIIDEKNVQKITNVQFCALGASSLTTLILIGGYYLSAIGCSNSMLIKHKVFLIWSVTVSQAL